MSMSDSVRAGYGRVRGRGRGRPPGLRGKEIGLWYAKRSQHKRQAREKKETSMVHMDQAKEHHITQLLDDIAESREATQSLTSLSTSFPISSSSSIGSLPGPSSAAESNSSSFCKNFKQEDVVSNQSCTRNNLDHHVSHMKHTVKSEESFDVDNDDSVWFEEPPNDIVLDDFSIQLEKINEANRSTSKSLITSVKTELTKNSELDDRLKNELVLKQSDASYQKMLEFRTKLPAFDKQTEILEMIRANQVVVISGETGCGKTTQVSQFILDDCIQRGNGSLCNVVCTQPRRISAISVAERVAEERAEPCGACNSVGYQIRLQTAFPREQGSILYCTTGIMLKWLEDDPLLSRTSHVILDEIHERDLHSDFLLIIVKDILSYRPNLKLVLMSATLNADHFSKYYGSCPMIHIPGFTFPVKELLIEDVIEKINYYPRDQLYIKKQRPRHLERRKQRLQRADELAMEQAYDGQFSVFLHTLRNKYSRQTIEALKVLNQDVINLELITALIKYIVKAMGEGAILTFLPGWADIGSLHKLLLKDTMFSSRQFLIIPLHSMMPTVNQKEVFNRPPPGVRKIILATNIAETSITIDDVVYVIDCGKIKLKNFEVENNITTLKPEWVSLANAKQRRGRAGRVQPGYCFHLYDKLRESLLESYLLPEILRTPLEELCLQIKLLRLGKIEPFVQKAIEPPSLDALTLAIHNLVTLNALTESEDLTPLGFHLARLPMDPHTGKMILYAAIFSCLDPVLTVAASLSFKDAFVIPLGKEKQADERRRELAQSSRSDHIMLINAFRGWERVSRYGNARNYCWDNFLSESALQMLSKMKRQFAEILAELKFLSSTNPKDPEANVNSDNTNLIKAVICAGLYPKVAKLKQLSRSNKTKPPKAMTREDGVVAIHPKSINVSTQCFTSRWLIYHLKMKTAKVYLFDTTSISPYPLLFFGGKIRVECEDGKDMIYIDDYINIHAPRSTAELVMRLRSELEHILEYKITHPGITHWSSCDQEIAILKAIVDLVTSEQSLTVGDYDDEDASL